MVHPAAKVVAPGVVRHAEGERINLGEPSGVKTGSIQELAGALKQADLRAPVRPRIRDKLWVKLWGNLSFNPIGALIRRMVAETEAVGTKIGDEFVV